MHIFVLFWKKQTQINKQMNQSIDEWISYVINGSSISWGSRALSPEGCYFYSARLSAPAGCRSSAPLRAGVSAAAWWSPLCWRGRWGTPAHPRRGLRWRCRAGRLCAPLPWRWTARSGASDSAWLSLCRAWTGVQSLLVYWRETQGRKLSRDAGKTKHICNDDAHNYTVQVYPDKCAW